MILWLALAASALADPCQAPNSANDVLACAKLRHPELQNARLGTEQSQDLERVAGQIPNPELDSKAVFGKTLGDEQSDIEVSLTQTLELGGKRGDRVREAEAKTAQVALEAAVTEAKVIQELAVTLHRLRQISAEKEANQETLSTFNKLIGQYQSRPRLNPEQEVSLSVFRISKSDYIAKQTVLEEEERDLLLAVKIATGLELGSRPALLPKAPEKWPELGAPQLQAAEQSPRFKLADASVKIAEAQLDLAKGSSWPDLKIGPALQFEQDGPTRSQLFGVTLSFALPLWNVNGAGRAAAYKGIALAESTRSVIRTEENAKALEHLTAYRAAVKALTEGLSLSELHKRHSRMESLSFQGLISGALVIEAHRQMIDFQKTRHELELKAIQKLWAIYAAEGRISKESL